MLKNIKNGMGIVFFMAFPGIVADETTIIQNIKKILLDPFFSFIEIAHIEEDKIRSEVKNLLEISNIRVGFDSHTVVLSDNLNINAIEEEERVKAVITLKKLLDEAYYMNAEGFSILSGIKPKEEYQQLALKNAIKSIKELCNYSIVKSKEFNLKPITIILETFDDKEFAKNRLIGPTKIAIFVANEVKKEFKNFSLLLDLSHLTILGENFTNSLKLARKFIKHIHLGNCIINDPNHQAYGDNHPRFCIGGGENDIDTLGKFLKELKKIGYLEEPENTLVFEVKPLKNEDPDLTIAGSKRILIRSVNKYL